MISAAWKCRLFSDGYCLQLEAFAIRGGRWRFIRFPSMMALLEHPAHGRVLFDAGYTERFFQATEGFPYRLYRWVTPVRLHGKSTALSALGRLRIAPEELQHLIISHFHADHLGGLRDFPKANLHCSQTAYRSIDGKRGVAALKLAFLPDLMPNDFLERARFIDDKPAARLDKMWSPFKEGWDLFGDKSLIAIDLPGHAAGQFGLAFRNDQGRPVFLVSDACWMSRAYRENMPPHWLGWIPQANAAAYRDTLNKLYQLHQASPEIQIVPTHCTETVYSRFENSS